MREDTMARRITRICRAGQHHFRCDTKKLLRAPSCLNDFVAKNFVPFPQTCFSMPISFEIPINRIQKTLPVADIDIHNLQTSLF